MIWHLVWGIKILKIQFDYPMIILEGIWCLLYGNFKSIFYIFNWNYKRGFGLTHLISNYSTIADLTDLIQSYSDEGLNLEGTHKLKHIFLNDYCLKYEVMWLDYEYNENGNAFTLDTGNFPKSSIEELLKSNQMAFFFNKHIYKKLQNWSPILDRA